jgi:hypothetical protein
MRLLKNAYPSLEFQWVLFPEEHRNTPNYCDDFMPEVVIFENIESDFALQEKYILGNLFLSNSLIFVEIHGKRDRKTPVVPP